MELKRPLFFLSLLFFINSCAGLLPYSSEDYHPQPGVIGVDNPNTCVAHIMVFEGRDSDQLLTWYNKKGKLVLSFRKSPISFDKMGYMEGINKTPANVRKMIIRPRVLQNVVVQVLHLIPDRYYTIVAYFTYAVSGNLIPVNDEMFWIHSFYVPAELRAHRDSFGQVSWLSAFIRLPRVNTQVIRGRFYPRIEINLGY